VGVRVLVMGSGGIGGFYGAMLAKAGNDVVFTARGAHLEAMQTSGLEIRFRGESTRLHPIQAVRFPVEAGGTFDLVLFAVKTYDTAEAATAIKPVVGPETSVLPLQNGIDSVDEIGSVVGADRVLAGSTLFSAKITEPGVLERLAQGTSLTVGEPIGARSERVERIVATFHAAGILDASVADDAQRALWEKLMFLAPIATVNSATGLPTGHIRAVPEGREMILAMQCEIRSVGQAAGVNLPDESAARVEAISWA
jgi:2-dehydropantoate 2-reductase